jgi:type II secretory pathway pseudopilin PulG
MGLLTIIHQFSFSYIPSLLLYLQSDTDNSSGASCCIVIVIIIVVAIVLSVKVSNEQQIKARQAAEAHAQALRQAQDAYQDSLKRLKSDPTNADLKQRTLELGRAYSNLTRNKEGVTVYDEVALMNDIGAATAGTTVPKTSPNVAPSIEERLAKLADLKSKGLINHDEYNNRRQRMLDEI